LRCILIVQRGFTMEFHLWIYCTLPSHYSTDFNAFL
jgi:hypothetical protein